MTPRIDCPSHLGEPTIAALAELLIDCVEGGASVGFMSPLTPERAGTFWRRIAAGVSAGERCVMIAHDDHGVVGTVQLVLSQPENQPHRADVVKMLVHRRARKMGLGAELLRTAERQAAERGKTLLVLDAVTNGDAARLYERLGWIRVGDVPEFALFPDGSPCSTTYFYRTVPAREGSGPVKASVR